MYRIRLTTTYMPKDIEGIIKESMALLSVYDKELKLKHYYKENNEEIFIFKGSLWQFRLLDLILQDKIAYRIEVFVNNEWLLPDELA